MQRKRKMRQSNQKNRGNQKKKCKVRRKLRRAESTQNATETAQTETEEQLPGQMNLPEDYQGTESIDVLGKTMQRKEYLDTLTAWGVAEYLHKNLTAEILGNREGLYEWLKGKVDERGYGMEDVNVL